jgi:dTDP-4-amino-4,6-dideoxygalactose transaminase
MPHFDEVEPFLRRMDSSGVYSNFGPLATELEVAYSAFLGVDPRNVVSCANATLAIQGAVSVLDPTTWVAPAYTFAATGHAVLGAGARLFLGDVRESDWTLDESPFLGDPQLGYLPVAPFGAPVELERWSGLPHVVVDGAASLGASEGLLRRLPEGWAVCFSLHATKVLPAGEGGLAVFGSQEAADRFRQWANFGFDRDRISAFPATNAKMSEVHAAYGLASLASWALEREEWMTALAEATRRSIRLGIHCLVEDFSGVRPYWVVRFADTQSRERAVQLLEASGIQSRAWWPALLTSMPAFAPYATLPEYPVAESLCATTLGLPMFRGISLAEFDIVTAVLERAFGRLGPSQ